MHQNIILFLEFILRNFVTIITCYQNFETNASVIVFRCVLNLVSNFIHVYNT